MGNKNAAGSHKGGVNYNSPKFLKAARRQAKGGSGAASAFLKQRNSSASKYTRF